MGKLRYKISLRKARVGQPKNVLSLMGVVISDSLWYDSRLFERSREIISSYTSQMQHGRGGWVVFLMQDVQFSYSQMILSTTANC